MLCYRNQSQVILQTNFLTPVGTPKLDVASASVRVYRIYNGSEENRLASTNLVQHDTLLNVFRYIWTPTSLAIGQYFIEYYAIDSSGEETYFIENLDVLNAPTYADFEIVKKIQTGKWKIENNQMIFYDTDETTELFVFDLFDLNGNPTNTNVMERVPQ